MWTWWENMCLVRCNDPESSLLLPDQNSLELRTKLEWMFGIIYDWHLFAKVQMEPKRGLHSLNTPAILEQSLLDFISESKRKLHAPVSFSSFTPKTAPCPLHRASVASQWGEWEGEGRDVPPPSIYLTPVVKDRWWKQSADLPKKREGARRSC